MSDWLKEWTVSDVKSAEDFSNYCQQVLGCPWPTLNDKVILKRHVKEIFKKHPQMDWGSMCRIVMWMRSRKIRVARIQNIPTYFRQAWRAGVLPELDPRERNDTDLEDKISKALEIEERPEWRRRLLASEGKGRKEVYESWLTLSGSR